MKNYFIKENYVSRLENKNFNDTRNKDQWQKEVYVYAKNIFEGNNFSKVLDLGCGSAYKLIKNFNKHYTTGMDLPKTVNWLRKKYPEKNWTDEFKPVRGYDMIIASDVIEHMPDPDELLDLIEQCNSKLIIFSTPDRDLLNERNSFINENGPPKNEHHVREWTMPEFKSYISSRFNVLEHFISNKIQATQVILAQNYTR